MTLSLSFIELRQNSLINRLSTTQVCTVYIRELVLGFLMIEALSWICGLLGHHQVYVILMESNRDGKH